MLCYAPSSYIHCMNMLEIYTYYQRHYSSIFHLTRAIYSAPKLRAKKSLIFRSADIFWIKISIKKKKVVFNSYTSKEKNSAIITSTITYKEKSADKAENYLKVLIDVFIFSSH